MAYVFFWVWWRIYIVCLVEFDCECFGSSSRVWLCTFSFCFDGVSMWFVWLCWLVYVCVPLLEFDFSRFLLSLMAYVNNLFGWVWLCTFSFEFDGVSILFVWLSSIAYVYGPLLEFDCVCLCFPSRVWWPTFYFDDVYRQFHRLSLLAYVFVLLLEFDCVRFLLSLMPYLFNLSGWVWSRMFFLPF